MARRPVAWFGAGTKVSHATGPMYTSPLHGLGDRRPRFVQHVRARECGQVPRPRRPGRRAVGRAAPPTRRSPQKRRAQPMAPLMSAEQTHFGRNASPAQAAHAAASTGREKIMSCNLSLSSSRHLSPTPTLRLQIALRLRVGGAIVRPQSSPRECRCCAKSARARRGKRSSTCTEPALSPLRRTLREASLLGPPRNSVGTSGCTRRLRIMQTHTQLFMRHVCSPRTRYTHTLCEPPCSRTRTHSLLTSRAGTTYVVHDPTASNVPG